MQLDILVENQGRVNYGPDLQDRKGLLGWVRLGINKLYHWTMVTLPLDDVSGLQFGPELASGSGPAFHRTHFTLQRTGDCFLELPGWRKGSAWINGFHLGRYWERGPQTALYVPAPLLRVGGNELVVLEQGEEQEQEQGSPARTAWLRPNRVRTWPI